jgi:nitronate monooxygenase
MLSARSSADHFCHRFGLDVPILLAPMAGACPTSLSIAVANAGGMGGCGALLMKPDAILHWHKEFQETSKGPAQINLWIPDPAPSRDLDHEHAIANFLGSWGPEVSVESGSATLPDFQAQCEALLAAKPAVISSVMGLYPPEFVRRMKSEGIAWFTTAIFTCRVSEPHCWWRLCLRE